MTKINLILFIYPLLILILMLNKNVNSSLISNEYFVDTCCSLNENENERIYLSCGLNEQIHLNLIQIYYNSDEYCSSELYCCKYQTKCSRRITKYSSLHCDQKNSCWIDRTCLKIYSPCSSLYGLYGQYITINYSCLPFNKTDLLYYQQPPVPFIVKLLTSEQTTKQNYLINKNILITKDWKSSPIFLISIILTFILFMLIIYWLAAQIAKRICRKIPLKKNAKTNTNTITTKILLQHQSEDKNNVQSTPSVPITRIYPSQPVYRYHQPYYDYDYDNRTKYRYNPYSLNPYRQYINVEHDPTSGQIYSRTFPNYFNYYPN